MQGHLSLLPAIIIVPSRGIVFSPLAHFVSVAHSPRDRVRGIGHIFRAKQDFIVDRNPIIVIEIVAFYICDSETANSNCGIYVYIYVYTWLTVLKQWRLNNFTIKKKKVLN